MEEKVWHKSYAAGVKPTLEYEQLTISQVVSRSAEKFAQHTALNYMGRRITYLELEQLSNRFAWALKSLGVKEGDKVSVILPNLPQTVVATYAVMKLGAVLVQNNPLNSERELAYQLRDSESKIAITLSLLIPRVLKVMPQTGVEKVIGCHIHSYLPFPKKHLFPLVKRAMHRKIETSDKVLCFDELIKSASLGPVEDKSRWDELAVLIYTGGTTGRSKGVMLSHRNISVNTQQLKGWFPELHEGEERLLGTFPMFHSAGFTTTNYFAWMGWEHIMIPRPEPKGIIDLIKKYKPTFLPGVPTIFVGLLADPAFRALDLSFLKGFFSGAAPLAADTIRDLKELTGATIFEVYGLTETSPVAAITPWGGEIKPGTVGIPVADTNIKIMGGESGEEELPLGESGEIVIEGPQVMMGYYNKPEETAHAIINGGLYTGDVGCFDDDGYLKIVDRKKDMIIASGYNIYPVEIDNVLFDHPKILEACTIGVPHEYRGETVKAFIVPREGETLNEAEVLDYCKANLAAYKIPKMIEFVGELPKSAVGKVLRRELRDKELAQLQESCSTESPE